MNQSLAEQLTKQTKLTEISKKSSVPVKNIHTEMFKQFRSILYVKPKYNSAEELTALFTEQESIVANKSETGH